MTTDNENNATAYPVVWVHKSIVDIAVTQIAYTIMKNVVKILNVQILESHTWRTMIAYSA